VTRIFIGQNYFGAGNLGDDLTLAGFLSVALRHPDVEISACTPYDVASRRRLFPQVRWLTDEEPVRAAALRDCDVWLGLGDTPFQLDSGPWLLDHNERERQRCDTLGRPMFLLGVGCESAAAAGDLRSRALLAATQRVWTRDELSTATLQPFVDRSRLTTGADAAHLAFGAGRAPERAAGVVGLMLAFERREQFDPAEIERFVQRRAPGRTRWLVQEARALPYVERWLLDHLAPETRARLAVMEIDERATSVGDYLERFGSPEVVVTSRYHGALVAARNGSKLVVVSRSAKLRGIAAELDLPELDRADSHRTLEAALETARSVAGDRLEVLRERARAMCDEFFELCAKRRFRTRPARNTGAAVVTMRPLEHASMRAMLQIEIPASLRCGEIVAIPCRVTNRGDAIYASLPPHPVQLCYRWFGPDGAPVGAGEWIHTPLPQPLVPGVAQTVTMVLAAPPRAGAYSISVTLLQEGIAWFDEVDAPSALRAEVAVKGA
jgi:hypothetical protein